MRLIAKSLFGLENVLASELVELGAKDVHTANRAVSFYGNKRLLYKVNYCSRLALSFLMPVASFRINDKNDLYKRCREIDWTEYIDLDMTFSIVPVVHSQIFNHTGYPALIVKDAVVDFFRDKYGKRPSVETENPSIAFNLHISGENVNISVDSSVVPLYKRGYRKEQGTAPLNEVLAAGLLKLSGWNGNSYLFDPMCGSGTILIEAGLMAANIPPGKFRRCFGFQKWKDYDEDLFKDVKSKADGKITSPQMPITGSDISETAVDRSVENIRNAGLSEYVMVNVADIKDAVPKYEEGYVVMNPPYGQRISPVDIDALYDTIGSVLKHSFSGHKAWILTSGKEYLNHIGLKPKVKYRVFNGSIECIFAGYDLYEGSRKRKNF